MTTYTATDTNTTLLALREAVYQRDWNTIWQLCAPFVSLDPDEETELVWDYLREHMGQSWCAQRRLPRSKMCLFSATFCNHDKGQAKYDTTESFDLRGAHFPKTAIYRKHLIGCDLSGADLRGVDFSGFELNNTNLSGAVLIGADLATADLTGVNLTGANLTRVDLRSANLEGANLTSAVLDEALMSKASYSADTVWPEGFDPGLHIIFGPGCNLEGKVIDALHLYYEDLRGAVCVGTEFEDSSLVECDLRGADLRNAILDDISLSRSDLSGANLQGASLFEANLEGANLQGATLTCDLQEANLRGANLKDADLRDTCLVGAKLEGANLEGARYDGYTVWPEGFDPTDPTHGLLER